VESLTPKPEITTVPKLQALLYRQREELATEVTVKDQNGRNKDCAGEKDDKCRKLLSDLKFSYGSYCTAPFACFSDAVSAV
jgi:hypothetical protein